VAVNVDTGEGPHLFAEERLRVLEIVVEEVGSRALVVAGLAASFTEQAGRLAADTARAGAGALLVFPISAYQGEPLDPEIPASYHRAIAEASGLPLIAFQLQPALGGVNFSAEAIERTMSVDGVVAIKEASFDAKRFVETARLVQSLPSRPTVLNGNDNFLLEAYFLGAEGALLGFGTLAAREQVQLLRAARDHDLPRALELRDMLQPLCDAIFARPVRDYRARIKHALTRLGVIGEAHVRPPLRPLAKDARELVDSPLQEAGLLEWACGGWACSCPRSRGNTDAPEESWRRSPGAPRTWGSTRYGRLITCCTRAASMRSRGWIRSSRSPTWQQ